MLGFKSGFALAALLSASTALDLSLTTEEGLEKYGFTYEKIDVKNELGYINPVFHLTGTVENGPFTEQRNSVLFNHGMGGDSSEFVNTMNPNKVPLALQLAKRGYDVWLGNYTGTKYSRHETMQPEDYEFWNFSWAENGAYDTPAYIEEMQKHNDGGKIAVVGHSMGTSANFAGAALRPDFFDEHVSVIVQMAPCTTPNQKSFFMYTQESWEWLEANKIGVIGGPNWESRDYPLIMAEGPPLLQSTATMLNGMNHVSLNQMAHYAQTSLSIRFQEFNPNWWNEEGADRRRPLMDIGAVKKAKFAFYVGLFDDTCPTNFARNLAAELGDSLAHYLVAPWEGHCPWGIAAGDWYIDDLERTLAINQ